jgi:precorrin-3B synthase
MDILARAREDACPGVFATHDAADGALARVRLPGGAVSAEQLTVLAGCAEDLGDGAAHLTSRGNIQLRGLTRGTPLVSRLSAAGLLPSAAHERVRNILASPRSLPARRLAADLDKELCARPQLAGLPGRFLFALDDGRGDISGEGADVCWRATGDTGALLLDGLDTGLRVSAGHAVEALLALAEAFLTVRGTAWRVRELADRTPLVAAGRGLASEVDPVEMPVSPGLPIGVIPQGVGVAPVFGRLTSAQLRLLAEVADQAVVTPWRSLLLPGVSGDALRTLADAGLVVDPDAASLGVSACIGRPGCAKSRADVRADASRVLSGLPAGLRVHFSGCERRCGKPAAEHKDVLAEVDGYRVDDVVIPVNELVEPKAWKGGK